MVDEVINYAGVSEAKVKSAQRCLISDLNTAAVKRAVSSLKLNREFMSLSISALARAQADWLYGINLTRAYAINVSMVRKRGAEIHMNFRELKRT